VRCLKAGVRVPGLRIVDVKSGALGVEWIEGWSVREVLGGGQEEDGLDDQEEGEEEQEEEEEDIAELLSSKGVSEGESQTFINSLSLPLSSSSHERLVLSVILLC